jgi:hypothetical protein
MVAVAYAACPSFERRERAMAANKQATAHECDAQPPCGLERVDSSSHVTGSGRWEVAVAASPTLHPPSSHRRKILLAYRDFIRMAS